MATVWWFVAAALAWACLDLAQVRATVGAQSFVALALLAQTLHAALGLSFGLAFVAVRTIVRPRLATDGTALSVAIAGMGLVVVGTYLNVVYLPKPTDPVTMAVNLGLVLSAIALAAVLARRSLVEQIAATGVPGASMCVAGALAAGLAIAAGHEMDEAQVVRPAGLDAADVFVIVVDTLRYDRTSLEPDGPKTTPHLEALAAEGTLYARAYVQSSWTKPSVASLFTSLYPSTHEANLRRDRLPAEAETLPEVFRAAGYGTAVFSANPWISPAFGFDGGVAHFVESEPETFARLVLVLRLFKLADRVAPGRAFSRAMVALEDAYGVRAPKRTNCLRDVALVEAFEQWMRRPRDAPRFAYFHLMSPHLPYEPPGREHLFPHAEQVALLQSTNPLAPERHRLLVQLYDATVEHGDAMVGRILAAIARDGEPERAVVVVTSDHGEEFFEHGRWGHGKSLYEEVVHVPLIVRGPAFARGGLVEEPVMLVDVLPTLMGVARLAERSGLEGTDLRAPPPGRNGYAELIREGGVTSFMVLDGRRKYIESVASLGESSRHELYDLGVDPDERRNLAEGPVGPLHERLVTLRTHAEAKRLEAGTTEIDEDAAERLRALGYLN